MIELSNGCICCTLREDLLTSLSALAAEKRFDHVLIESSGISEPLPVAETFTYHDKATGVRLNDVASLANLVSVVDAASIFEQLQSMDTLVDRGWQDEDSDKRTVAHLLCDQLEVPPFTSQLFHLLALEVSHPSHLLPSLSFTTFSHLSPLHPTTSHLPLIPPLLSLRTCSFSIRSTW